MPESVLRLFRCCTKRDIENNYTLKSSVTTKLSNKEQLEELVSHELRVTSRNVFYSFSSDIQKVRNYKEKYQPALIVVFDFYPISVFRLLKMSCWEMFDAYECPTKEMEEVDEFFENRLIYVSKDNLMIPFDCSYSAAGYGELMCEYGR